MCGYDTDLKQICGDIRYTNMKPSHDCSALTCAAAANVMAHGNVQPLAWNIGRILFALYINMVPTKSLTADAYHKYVELTVILSYIAQHP